MDFSSILKNLRTTADMNQEELANMVNLRSSAISKYENGLTEPSIDTLKNFSDIFNVSLDYLLGKSTVKNPYSEDNITPKEFNLIVRFRKLSSENKIRIDERINTMLDGR